MPGKSSYPVQVREIVIRLKKSGKSAKEISELLQISGPTISRWLRRTVLQAAPRGGGKPRELGVDLVELVKNNPHKTLAQLAEGLPIKRSALRNRLHKAGISFKKKVTHTKKQTQKNKNNILKKFNQ